MRTSRWKGALTPMVGLALAGLLAACGSSSKSSTSTAGTTATSGPGVGKPAVVIGDKNFTEEYILGSLYAQALAAKGYKVVLKGNIGSSEITWKALTSGQIDMYPEYTGTLLSAIAGDENPPTSAQETYSLAQAYVNKHGFQLLNQTPFYDSDALAATKAYASAHGLA